MKAGFTEKNKSIPNKISIFRNREKTEKHIEFFELILIKLLYAKCNKRKLLYKILSIGMINKLVSVAAIDLDPYELYTFYDSLHI
mgnify:CR=1 FL=1